MPDEEKISEEAIHEETMPKDEQASIPLSPPADAESYSKVVQEPMADVSIPTQNPQELKPEESPLSLPEVATPLQAGASLPEEIPPVSAEPIPLEPKDMQANSTSNGISEPSVEPISETQTAQFPGNEPLKAETLEMQTRAEATPPPSNSVPAIIAVSNKNKIIELLAKAKNVIQFRKRKKLDKIMTLFLKQSKITNDEVEKILHVSDATATRYLSQLEKEGKIKQVGKTGHAVSYSLK